MKSVSVTQEKLVSILPLHAPGYPYLCLVSRKCILLHSMTNQMNRFFCFLFVFFFVAG